MIYKYLAKERLDVLRNATLRATQAEALNDPFELKPYFAVIAKKDDLKQAVSSRLFLDEEMRNIYAKFPNEMRARMSFRQFKRIFTKSGNKQFFESWFTSETDRLYDMHFPKVTEEFKSSVYTSLGKNFGIISFSEVSDETLMWSHYASEHKGFVVEFNKEHPFFNQKRTANDEFLHLRPVDYPVAIPSYEALGDLDGTKLLCVKQSKWSYEREWRMLFPVDPNSHGGIGEPIHLIDFPRRAVTSIIFGARTSEDTILEINSILDAHSEYREVKVKFASVDISRGQIVIRNTR